MPALVAPDSTAFRVLDLIADSYDPVLALLALAAPAIDRGSRSGMALLRYYAALGIGLGVVYLVQAADQRFGLWPAAGLDYSTHVAFAVSVATSAYLARARRAGLRVNAWTVDEPDEMRRLIALGLDGIITDRPAELLSLVSGGGR